MKKTIFIVMSLLFTVTVVAQNEKAFFDYLIQKDMDNASSYFGKELNLCIGDFEEMVSPSSAKQKLNTFFKEHSPVSYAIRHKGNSKGGNSSYFVVDLQTSTGLYRLFTYFDQIGNQNKISELRIEK